MKPLTQRFAIKRMLGQLLLFGLLCSNSSAATHPQVIRLVSDEWCPYTCSEHATNRGLMVDIVTEIMEPQGFLIEYNVMPWSRAKNYVTNGRADVALGISKVTTDNLLVNNEALCFDETVLVWRRGEGKVYTGPEILDESVVGVSDANVFDNNGELDEYILRRTTKRNKMVTLYEGDTPELLLRMLLGRHIDVFPENRQVISHLIKSGGHEARVELSLTGKGNNLYVALSPSDRGQQYAEMIDAGILELKDSGRMQELLQKYGLDNDPAGISELPLGARE